MPKPRLATWSIYVLKDPRTLTVRYVGVTGNPRDRLNRHLQLARNGTGYRCAKWIRTLLREGREPEMELIDSGDGNPSERERHWIAKYRAEGARLTNITNGGEFVDAAAREILSRKLKGRVVSEETCRKISEAKRARKTKRPDNISRMRALAARNLGKQMNLSEDERQRRRTSMQNLQGSYRHWVDHVDAAAKKAFSGRVADQMRGVWQRRKRTGVKLNVSVEGRQRMRENGKRQSVKLAEFAARIDPVVLRSLRSKAGRKGALVASPAQLEQRKLANEKMRAKRGNPWAGKSPTERSRIARERWATTRQKRKVHG